MSLTVNSRVVADIQVAYVMLRPLVGAYELIFMLDGMTIAVPSTAPITQYWLVLYGAEVTMTPASGGKVALGFARPNQPFRIQQSEYQSRVGVELKIVLHPHQVSAIEEYRNSEDLRFELNAIGEGGDTVSRWPTYDTLGKQLPRSEWITQLRSARALDIMLLEVPMPVADIPPQWRNMAEHLKQAQKMFLEGHYSECVAECRHVIEATNGSSSTQPQWTDALKMLAAQDTRQAMSKEQRESAIFAAVRHYTHTAHHPNAGSGAENFSRSEAKLTLTLCASLVAYQLNGGIL